MSRSLRRVAGAALFLCLGLLSAGQARAQDAPEASIAGGAGVTEGTAASFTLALSTAPATDLVIGVECSDSGDFATVSPIVIAEADRTVASGATTRTFNVATTADDVDELDGTITCSLIAGTGYTIHDTDNSAAVTVADDDERGLWINADQVVVDEGGSETWSVKLTSRPLGTVTVSLSGEGSGIQVSTDTNDDEDVLLFSPDKWNEAQTVTVSAAADDNAADESVRIDHTPSGGGYSATLRRSVQVTVDDSSDKGISFAKSNYFNDPVNDIPHIVYDEGVQRHVPRRLNVNLTSAPTSDVTVTVTSNHPEMRFASAPHSLGEHYSTSLTITLTPEDWQSDQAGRVYYAAYPDLDTFNNWRWFTAEADGGGYDGVVGRVQVRIIDADEVAFELPILDSVYGNTILEGQTLSSSMAIFGSLSSDVTVSLAVSPDGGLSVSPASMTFTPSNATQAQPFTLTAAQDNDSDDESYVLRISATIGSDEYSRSYDLVIEDDDSPGLLFGDLNAGQMHLDEAGSATYRMRLTTQPESWVRVEIAGEADGVSVTTAAHEAKDWLTFTESNWETLQTVTVSAALDDNGADETVRLRHKFVSGDSDYKALTDKTITVLTNDINEAPPAPVVSAQSVTAGQSFSYVIGAVYDPDLGQTVSLAATRSDGTALPFWLTFTPSTRTFSGTPAVADIGTTTVRVTATDSGAPSLSTTADFQLTVEAPDSLTLTVDTDSGTSGNQDAVGEAAGETTVLVTATLDGANRFAEDKTVTVQVGNSGDGAVEGADYDTVADFPITIAAGAASGSATFKLTPTNDVLDESNEMLSVEGNLTGVAVTGDTITITDDDAAPTAITLTVDTDSETDGNQDAVAEDVSEAPEVTVTATLDGTTRFAESKTVTVEVGKTGDSAESGTDYEAVTGVEVTIAAGAASGSTTFTLTPTDDDLDEGTGETLSLEGELTGVTVTGDTITITDDDSATDITLTVDTDGDTDGDQDAVGEGADETTVTVTATVDGASRFVDAQEVTVSVGKTGDSAESGTDYEAVTAFAVTIAAGAASGSATFTLTPTDDVLDEGSSETLSVEGSHTDSAITVTGDEITITDDDAAPRAITLTVDTDGNTDGNQDAVGEAAGETTVTVAATLGGTTRFATDQTVTVTVGKDTDSAESGTDYGAVTGVAVTISAGEASGSTTFKLTPTNDVLDEPNEALSVDGALTGVTVTGDTITITDDDAAPGPITLTVDTDGDTNGDQDAVGEAAGETTVTLTATLGGTTRFATDQTVTVMVGKQGDSATSGTDYGAVTGVEVTISAGAASGSTTFKLTPTNDVYDESDETLSVEGALSGATVTGDTITITDDDAAATATLTVDTDGDTNGNQDTVGEAAGDAGWHDPVCD